jgi:hypothetical protein
MNVYTYNPFNNTFDSCQVKKVCPWGWTVEFPTGEELEVSRTNLYKRVGQDFLHVTHPNTKKQTTMNKTKAVFMTASMLALTTVSSFAQAADPAGEIAKVDTAFQAAAGIAVAMLGFALVFRAVRKFTKG